MEDLKELNSSSFTAILLMSVYRLFFKRAPETKKLLSTIFAEVL